MQCVHLAKCLRCAKLGPLCTKFLFVDVRACWGPLSLQDKKYKAAKPVSKSGAMAKRVCPDGKVARDGYCRTCDMARPFAEFHSGPHARRGPGKPPPAPKAWDEWSNQYRDSTVIPASNNLGVVQGVLVFSAGRMAAARPPSASRLNGTSAAQPQVTIDAQAQVATIVRANAATQMAAATVNRVLTDAQRVAIAAKRHNALQILAANQQRQGAHL